MEEKERSKERNEKGNSGKGNSWDRPRGPVPEFPQEFPLNSKGFTLIELIVVLVILGLLAGVVGPRLWNRVGQSKAQVARLQIEQLGNALALFRFDVGHYPTSGQGLQALVEDQGIQNWSGPYLEKKNVPKDTWGRDYQYRAPGENGDYDLWSFGADGMEGGDGDDADINSWE